MSDISNLIKNLKAAPQTLAQIAAMQDIPAYLASNSAIAVQQVRSTGAAVTTTTDANGNTLYQILS